MWKVFMIYICLFHKFLRKKIRKNNFPNKYNFLLYFLTI